MLIFRDDNIIFNGLLYYVVGWLNEERSINVPIWRADGLIISMLLHAGPVEFLYYWLHRALHHHFLYSRYHSHHHSSIVTEPITCNLLSFILSTNYSFPSNFTFLNPYFFKNIIDHDFFIIYNIDIIKS